MKKIIQVTAVLYILMFSLHFNAKSQTAHDALQEIGRIKNYYYNRDTTSIYKVAHYEIQDSTGYRRDTLYETYLADKGNYYKQSVVTYPGTHRVSFEINNADYNIFLDEVDSLVRVNNPVSLEHSMLLIDFFEGDFYSQHIDSIRVYDTTAGRKMYVYFNSNSPFKLYEMYYDSAEYKINKLQIRIKIGEYLGNPLFSNMTWTCTHSLLPAFYFIPSIIYYSNRVFTRVNKEYSLIPTWAGFELINFSGK